MPTASCAHTQICDAAACHLHVVLERVAGMAAFRLRQLQNEAREPTEVADRVFASVRALSGRACVDVHIHRSQCCAPQIGLSAARDGASLLRAAVTQPAAVAASSSSTLQCLIDAGAAAAAAGAPDTDTWRDGASASNYFPRAVHIPEFDAVRGVDGESASWLIDASTNTPIADANATYRAIVDKGHGSLRLMLADSTELAGYEAAATTAAMAATIGAMTEVLRAATAAVREKKGILMVLDEVCG